MKFAMKIMVHQVQKVKNMQRLKYIMLIGVHIVDLSYEWR